MGADPATRDVEAIKKWEEEGWQRSGPSPKYLQTHSGTKFLFQMLKKQVNAGNFEIKDYSEFGGIILLTRKPKAE